MNYTWHIAKLGLNDELNHEGQLLENAIVTVQWKRVAEDTDGTKSSYVGKTNLSVTDMNAADFVALNDVTNEMVVGWVTDNLTDAQLNQINAQLDEKVERNRVRKVRPSW